MLPVIATTGVLSNLASYNPFKRWIAPGPEVATQTPELTVYFAYAQAINAQTSSCLTSINLILSCLVLKASINPLIPSPGNPKMVSTFQSSNASAIISAVRILSYSLITLYSAISCTIYDKCVDDYDNKEDIFCPLHISRDTKICVGNTIIM